MIKQLEKFEIEEAMDIWLKLILLLIVLYQRNIGLKIIILLKRNTFLSPKLLLQRR